MKRTLLLLSCFAMGLGAADGEFRQVYDLDPVKVKQNELLVQQAMTNADAKWQKAPVLYSVIPPLSSVPRLPDTFPADGTFCSTLGVIAAQDEFEPASFVVYPKQNVDSFSLTASDLKSEDGTVFPAEKLDLKLVKVWYQAGSAWYGYFADALTHALVPELLLNDENLVRVDTKQKENYVRYNNEDGSIRYEWMSAPYTALNFVEHMSQANTNLMSDAEKLQPVVLNKNEFKQFMLTVHVPENTKPGLYQGAITMNADGKSVGTIPLSLRVLPFKLPVAGTYRDPLREYFICLYGTGTRHPKILKNLAEHNSFYLHNFPFADPFYPERFKADVKLAKEYGLKTGMLMSATPGCGFTMRENPPPEKIAELNQLKYVYGKTAELVKEVLGHTNFYSYGVDEGDFWVIKRERAAWDAIHEAGGNVMVSTRPHGASLYGLDYAAFAFAPVGKDVAEVKKYHQMNPDAHVGWYANPHSAPENPDLFRRMHGYVAYKGDFDASSNYCWWRGNWNDHSCIDEHAFRGLIMVYATKDDVLDTLEWEGVREGVDDIRYLTCLQILAEKALKHKDWKVQRLARTARAFFAYSDHERDAIDPIRMECISYILKLQEALKNDEVSK